jgi:hypothetical protein
MLEGDGLAHYHERNLSQASWLQDWWMLLTILGHITHKQKWNVIIVLAMKNYYELLFQTVAGVDGFVDVAPGRRWENMGQLCTSQRRADHKEHLDGWD